MGIGRTSAERCSCRADRHPAARAGAWMLPRRRSGPTNNASIGGAIGKVLRDAELADDLRRLGRKRAAEFSWERTARETLRAYREVLADAAVPSATA